MSELRAALAFLTRVPVAAPASRTGAAGFGLAGAAIGVAGAVPILLVGGRSPGIAALLAIALVVALTGALHVDGLADTADALVAPDAERAEAARRDPRIGSGGAVALVIVLGIDVVALAGIAGSGLWPRVVAAAAALVAATAASRSVAVVVARVHGSAAAGSRLGAWFVERVTTLDAAAAVLGAVAAIAVAGLVTTAAGGPGVAVAAGGIIGGLAGAGLGLAVANRRGGVDGDVLGASIELAQAAVLAAAAVIVGA